MKIDFNTKKTEADWQRVFDDFCIKATPKWFEWLGWVLILGALTFLTELFIFCFIFIFAELFLLSGFPWTSFCQVGENSKTHVVTYFWYFGLRCVVISYQVGIGDKW
jgi:hypothetical protein